MQTISFSDARNNLKHVLDRVANDRDITLITRRNGEDAVVMSLDTYNSLTETLHLLKNARQRRPPATLHCPVPKRPSRPAGTR